MLLIGRQLHCSVSYTNSVVMPKDGSSSFEKTWPTKSELRCAYYGRNKLAE
jgi:hypothetical protein